MEITTEEYTLLFNTITDTIKTLEMARLNLVVAQQQAEEIVISTSSSNHPQKNV